MLALTYGIKNVGLKKSFLVSFVVGIFHFFMPLIGNCIGISIFEYTFIKPRYILFLIFLILSLDMLIHFFEKEEKTGELNMLGIIIFALSVSFDSLSVGLAIRFIYDNIFITLITFLIITFFITLLGFMVGSKISNKLGKLSFLLSSLTLFTYSIYVLTN